MVVSASIILPHTSVQCISLAFSIVSKDMRDTQSPHKTLFGSWTMAKVTIARPKCVLSLTVQILPLHHHYHIIDLVSSSAIGWTHADSLKLRHPDDAKEPKESQTRAFLAVCCLVSKDWLDYARRLLYRVLRLTPALKRLL